MAEWQDVTDNFSEERRYYSGTYLEIDEVYGDELEVSVFSPVEAERFEIYFSYGYFYGIVYADEDNVYEIRDQMKKDLQKAYDQTKEPEDKFVDWFVKKYHVELPNDAIINFDISELAKIWDDIM